jgi:monovalent cation/proton antiporter MnhG/PhaG subunit
MTQQHPIITGCLLGLAVLLILMCALGLLVMRHAYQRLQFSTPVVTVSMALIVAAVWIEDDQWQSRIKATLIWVILFLMNSILSHATARAIRIREVGSWPTTAEEHIPLVKNRGEAGAPGGPGRGDA